MNVEILTASALLAIAPAFAIGLAFIIVALGGAAYRRNGELF